MKRKAHYAAANAAYTKATGELADLKAEIIRSIRGESALPKDVLAELIRENETKEPLIKSARADGEGF